MRRFAIAAIALLLILLYACGGEVEANSQASPPPLAGSGTDMVAAMEKSGGEPQQRQGYTIAYDYDPSWQMEEEKTERVRYTYFLLDDDIQNRKLLTIAEVEIGDADINDPTVKQLVLAEIEVGEQPRPQATSMAVSGAEGMELSFTHTSGNTTMNGMMYLFQWKGYAYAFSYLSGGELEQGDAEQLQSVLDGVVLQ